MIDVATGIWSYLSERQNLQAIPVGFAGERVVYKFRVAWPIGRRRDLELRYGMVATPADASPQDVARAVCSYFEVDAAASDPIVEEAYADGSFDFR